MKRTHHIHRSTSQKGGLAVSVRSKQATDEVICNWGCFLKGDISVIILANREKQF